MSGVYAVMLIMLLCAGRVDVHAGVRSHSCLHCRYRAC